MERFVLDVDLKHLVLEQCLLICIIPLWNTLALLDQLLYPLPQSCLEQVAYSE